MNAKPDQPGLPVPATLEQAMAPEWLTTALASDGDGSAISSVVTLDVSRNFATKVRFSVTFAGDSKRRTYCLKGLFGAGKNTELAGAMFASEADFYCAIAPAVELRVPACVCAVIDTENAQTIIVMRDLIEMGASFCSVFEPFSPDEAAVSLAELAKLHQRRAMLDQERWIRPRAADLMRLSQYASEPFQERLDTLRSDLPGDLRDADRLNRAMGELTQRDSRRLQFMLHGDAHAGNIYRTTGGPGFCDWQLFQRGGWALDVAYHLNTVLPSRIAAVEERRLLGEYLALMRAVGIDMPGDDEAWNQYREAVIYGLYLWTGARRIEQPIAAQFIERLGKAAVRLESLSLLGIS